MEFRLTKARFTDAQRFTSKAFRRGSAHELLQTGHGIDTLKGSGGWDGQGFLSYFEAEIDAPFNAQKMLISLSDGDSSEEDQPKPEKTNIREK